LLRRLLKRHRHAGANGVQVRVHPAQHDRALPAAPTQERREAVAAAAGQERADPVLPPEQGAEGRVRQLPELARVPAPAQDQDQDSRRTHTAPQDLQPRRHPDGPLLQGAGYVWTLRIYLLIWSWADIITHKNLC